MSVNLRALRAAVARPFQRSLGVRLVALCLGLLAIVQVAGFGAIKNGLREQAYRALPETLAVADRVLQSQLADHAQKRAERVRLLGADFGLHTVVGEDAETLRSVLEHNAVGRTGADEAALFGTDFALRAQHGTHLGSLAAELPRLAADTARTGSARWLTVLAGRPHFVALAPVKPVDGPLLGWVMMSFPLEASLIQDLRDLSRQDFTLLVRDDPAAAWHSALSSLPAASAAALAARDWSREAQGMQSVRLRDEEVGVRSRWLGRDGDARLLALSSASIDDATRVPHELQFSLLAITLGGFAAFAIGGLYSARRVMAPLRSLTRAAERLGAGDYETPMRGLRRADEIGTLAKSFETMRVGVAEKQAQLLRLAYWDALTGLPNRAQFRDATRAALRQAREHGRPVAVIMLDLDRFKRVNDVLGYPFGDLLLKGVAQRLTQQILRDGDLVARLSGDEFAVLLRDADGELAASVAQRIATALAHPLVLQEHKVDTGASLGLACAPQHGEDADTLLSRAEIAMYAAKRGGRGAMAYDPSFDAGSAQTLSLLSGLRQAIGQGELQLHLQPKLALADASVVGAEALVRWQHPVHGMVPPLQFIPYAEQTGFIRQMTIWVFESAARLWLELHGDGVPLRLSVNLSARDLLDQDLPDKLDALLIRHRVPAEGFCLEITERAIMDDPQRALGTLQRLSAMGFTLSIDDFGTGYSSLACLKRLPIDELKIDKSFVMNMQADLDDAKIVRSTIDLAHNLGLTVVAEGVENARTWELLRELHCDQAQGYHIGKPMPREQFRRWSAGWIEKRRASGHTASRPVLH